MWKRWLMVIPILNLYTFPLLVIIWTYAEEYGIQWFTLYAAFDSIWCNLFRIK